MRPRIGINANVKAGMRRRGDGRLLALSPDYARCVAAAGGLPVVLPPFSFDGRIDEALVADALAGLDGLVLSGGDDIDPSVYGQARHSAAVLLDRDRDRSDLTLARRTVAAGLPVLGVCGGMQLLNVVLGGDLHQHLADLRATLYPSLHPIHDAQETEHVDHAIEVARDSRLAEITGAGPMATNSRHHQAIARVADGLAVAAVAEDGVVEAIESKDPARFLLGVQWHPEEMPDDPRQARLFRALVDAAARARTGGAPVR